jgi:CheY-like chemotaxis protein
MVSILVVEDVPAVLMSLRIVLQGNGHRVTGATNGTEGLELLKGMRFDLAITDIWMPGLSGIDLIEQGRRCSPSTRFLAITGGDPSGRGSPQTPHQKNFGADALLLKPFEKQELLHAVSALLAA